MKKQNTGKKAAFKTIYTPGCAFGGYEYRATSNGETVHVQERSANAGGFRTVKTMDKGGFDAFAERFDIYNPNNNPAPIARLIEGHPDYQ